MTNLHTILRQGAEPYRDRWIDCVKNQYTKFYHNIHERLPYARQRCNQFKELINDLASLNVGEEVTAQIRNLEKQRRPFLHIITAVPALYDTLDKYLNNIVPRLNEDYDNHLDRMATLMLGKGINPESASIIDVTMSDRQMVLTVQDSEGHRLDGNISWSSIGSMQQERQISVKVSFSKQLEQNTDIRHFAQDDAINRKEDNNLKQRLNNILDQLAPQWKQLHLHNQANYYDYISRKLPFSRQRLDELQSEITKLQYLRADMTRIKALKKLANVFKHLLNTPPAMAKDKQDYLLKAENNWAKRWDNALHDIAEYCRKSRLNLSSTKISSLVTNKNGAAITLTDQSGLRTTVTIAVTGQKQPINEPGLSVKGGEVSRINRGNRTLVSLQDAKPQLTTEQLITRAKIVEYHGKLFVTCHIKGKRQRPVPMIAEEWQKYKSQNGSDKTALAMAHYPKEIAKALQGETLDTDRPNLKTIKI